MNRIFFAMNGFTVRARRSLPEYRAEGTHLVHDRTGCEVLHLATADTENLFAFCFATPPGNDTGVAHIIEHSVLSGSRLFPVKEPFSVLMRGSMHTFLNALTYPDRTVYPAASCNRTDFYNLMAVYGDAVFHPLLRKETFMQEAWRVEDGEGGPDARRFAGVVYNEMKGARSSADAVASEWMARSLLPDTPYRYDSGGDPARIPELSLDGAREFHARYYHPSNCRIFLYGNIPLPEILETLDKSFLSGFTRARPAPGIPPQPAWSEPRRLVKSYGVRPDTPLDRRSSVTVGWLLPAVTDPLRLVTHEVLSEILVESAGSPLRKALIDSGLGEDLSPVSGLEIELQRMIFAAGLRGTDPDREADITGLVMDTVSRLASRGIEKPLVESMMNRVEFRHREIRGNGSPYALRLMGRVLRGWIHGGEPFASLEFGAPFQTLKERLVRGDGYLEACLKSGLVSNPHRLVLVVRPDRDQEAREAAAEKSRLDSLVAAMGPMDKKTLQEEAAAFRAFQAAPDSPEMLARVPSLHRSDLPRSIEPIPIDDTRTPGGISLSLHDIFTNEVISLDFAFSTASLSNEQALLLPLFSRAVCGMGLPGKGYDAVALDLFRLTGGFSGALDAGGIVGKPDEFGQFLFFRTRCLRQNLPAAASLIGGLLSTADFRDFPRLRDILVELRNDMKAALVPNGHQFAMLRAASMISDAVAREEQWRGITQLLFLEERVKGGEAEVVRVAGLLEGIRSALLRGGALLANATATRETFADIAAAVDEVGRRLEPPGGEARAAAGAAAQPKAGGKKQPGHAAGSGRAGVATGRADGGESLVISASVGYVARAVPGFRYEHPLNSSGAVLGHLLSTGYLWEKVRMEGGAYGAFSYPRNTDGLFLFGSYRDPHITRTLRAFSEGLAFMRDGGVGDDDVEKAVIGTVGREDRPIDPGEKGFVSLQRKLHGITDRARQERRDKLLAVDRAALGEAARALQEGFARGFTAVISNRRALDEARGENPELGGRVLELPE
jgi:Zn-dependent M16 (insulinase) family peptidase